MAALTRAMRIKVSIAAGLAAVGTAATVVSLADASSGPARPAPAVSTTGDHPPAGQRTAPVPPRKPKPVDLTPAAKTPIWQEDSGAIHAGQTSSTAPVVTRVDASKMYLRMTGGSLAKQAAAVEKRGGVKVASLGKVPLNRTYVEGVDRGPRQAIPSTRIKGQGPIEGFRWNAQDESTSSWFPQSITTSSDSNLATGKIDGKNWVLVAWHNADNSACRVSLVDQTHPNDPKLARYRNVELVRPVARPPGSKLAPYESIASHGSGLVLYKNYLYETEGTKIRVFDINRIWQDRAGKWVLPQVQEADGPGSAVLEHGNTPSFSGMSLDQVDPKAPALLGQEYSFEKNGRVYTIPLDSKTGQLKVGADGRIPFTSAFVVPLKRMAGAVDLGDGWLQLGTMDHVLYLIHPGARPLAANALPKGSQQMSFNMPANKVMILDEHENNRVVAGITPSKIP